MSNPYLQIDLRPALESDISFIQAAWIESYRNSPFGRDMTSETYHQYQLPIIHQSLAQHPVTVACLRDDPDTICGFICHSRHSLDVTFVHYLYVKLLFRKDGLAKRLFQSIEPTTPTVCTHTNQIFRSLKHKADLINLRDFNTLCQVSDDPKEAYRGQQSKRAR